MTRIRQKEIRKRRNRRRKLRKLKKQLQTAKSIDEKKMLLDQIQKREPWFDKKNSND